MNKKQVCKISCDTQWGKSFNGYGICVGDDLFLLENGYVLAMAGEKREKNLLCDRGLFALYMNNMYDMIDNMAGTSWERVTEINVSATRNVPTDIREAMENAAENLIQMRKLHERFQEDKEKFNRMMEERNKVVKAMPAIVRESKGLLSKDEFAKAFEEALPENVRYAMEHSAQRNYSGNMEGNFKVNIYSNIQIERHVWIDKWAKPSFTYLEYDDTRAMYDDAETFPEYKEYLKKYSKRLPVSPKAEFSEYLALGDKNSLGYYGMYFIEIDDRKPLTKEYAEKLADEFAGIKRTKNKDNYDMER